MSVTAIPAAVAAHDPRDAWPSVTRILKAAGLSPWQDVTLEQLRRGVQHGLDERKLRYILQGVDPAVLDAKAELGKMAHLAVEDIERGMTEAWWADSEIAPYAAAYLKFKSEMDYRAAAVELRVYNDAYHYQGTLDSWGQMGEAEVVVDIKTTVAMPADLPYQLAGYDLCLAANPKRSRWGVQLKPDGTYRLNEYAGRNDAKIFLAAVAIAHTKGIL